MIAVFILSLIAARQTSQPSPRATLPPEIIHTVTSETCSALTTLLLPVGHVSKINDEGFAAMSTSVSGYMSHFMAGDDPHIGHPSLAVSIGGRSRGAGGAAGAAASSSQGDDPITYGPDQTVKMSRINEIAGQLAENITYERGLLTQSYTEQPRGTNTELDALRQKTENLIETQNALMQRYQTLASVYLQNIGEAGMECNGGACLGGFKANLRALIIGSAAGLDTDSLSAISAEPNGYKDFKQLSKVGTSPEVIGAMRFNERQYTAALFGIYNECHGTHFVIPETTQKPVMRLPI